MASKLQNRKQFSIFLHYDSIIYKNKNEIVSINSEIVKKIFLKLLND